MDKKLFLELDDIRMELERGISMITVVADGLDCYTRHCSLTGSRAEAYVDAVIAVGNALSAVSLRLQNTISGTNNLKKKKEAVA